MNIFFSNYFILNLCSNNALKNIKYYMRNNKNYKIKKANIFLCSSMTLKVPLWVFSPKITQKLIHYFD